MKKSHYIFSVIIALVCITTMQSCFKHDPLTIKHNSISVDNSEISLIVTQQQKKFTITSKVYWEITAVGLNGTNGGWYTLSAVNGSGDMEVTVDAQNNPTGQERIAVLTIKGQYNEVTVTLKQDGDGDGMLEVAPALLADFRVSDAATQTFTIVSPFEWTITFKDKTTYTDPLNPAIDPQWATVDVAGGEGDKTITVTAKNNGTGNLRTGEFTITAAGKSKTVTVNQLKDLNQTFDPDFLTWCLDSSKGNVDTNRDGSITQEEVDAVTQIDCSNQSLSSLKGIENFAKLEALNCGDNQLASLDVSKNTELTWMGCNNNQLTTLDVSKNTKLTHITLIGNQIGILDVSNNIALTELQCQNNNLTALDVSKNTKLTNFYCFNNQLTTLDVSKNTALIDLYCYNNPALATIDISGSSFTKLGFFMCASIAPNAKVFVWNGFIVSNAPGGWSYPSDVTWVLPS